MTNSSKCLYRLLSKVSIIVALLIVSLIPLWAAYSHHTFLNDDTYITLTYAKNLAYGHGFVFNYGQPTLGTTTPLLALIVAGLAVIIPWVEISTLAVFFTAFCWIGIVWTFLLFRKSWEISISQAAIIGLVIIASGWIGYLGMEAYLFAFLLILSLSLFHSNKFYWAGATAGLLFMTRGEGVIFIFVLLLFSIISRILARVSHDSSALRPAIYLLAGFSLPVLLWFIYAWFTFESLFPNTLAAKIAQGQSTLWWPFFKTLTQKWIHLWGDEYYLGFLRLKNLWRLLVFLGLSIVIIKKHKFLPLLVWGVLYTTGYSILGIPAYEWYQLPIIFVLQICFAIGVIQCVDFIVSNTPKSLSIRSAASICVVFSLLLLIAKPTLSTLIDPNPDLRRFTSSAFKGENYIELSKWFRTNTKPHESIAYIEIGYLGYYTDNRIIDLAGLILPDVIPYVAKGDFTWAFWHYKPDYYIHLQDFDWALASIRSNPVFDEQYQPVASLSGKPAFNADFVIYKRVKYDVK